MWGVSGISGLYSIKKFQPVRVHLWRHPQYQVKKNRKTPLMRGRKTPLPQRGPAARQHLTLSGDDFADLAVLPPDIGSLTALSSLNLSDTHVSDISALFGLTALSSLNLSRTQVSDISALSGLTALSRLDLRRTPVSDISALSGLTALIDLNLSGTPVSDISALSGLTALTDLDLRGTQVSDISALSGLTALIHLDLFGTQVSDISGLSGLTALNRLNLFGTQVSDISALSGLTALNRLYLSGTPVSDISALSGLTALNRLYLSDTPVSDISALSGLTALIHLELSDTLVSDLSPILPLTQLADAPAVGGLAFRNTAAALADPRIAEIAEIEDNAKRAIGLFAYLSEIPKDVARSIEKLDTRVDTTQQDVTELETRVSTAIERLDGFDADYESRLDAAATAFRETNALKAPVVLWQEKETKHQAESATARNFFIGSLIATGVLVIVLASLLIFK